jgi:hypothetical protein
MSRIQQTGIQTFVTQQQADQDVRDDIARGEREYRRDGREDRPKSWETDEPEGDE